MRCVEDAHYSEDYHNPDSRSIGNAITITLKDGTVLGEWRLRHLLLTRTDEVAIKYPVGHKRRRDEGIPLLISKLERHVKPHFSADKTKQILDLCADQKKLEAMPVNECVEAHELDLTGQVHRPLGPRLAARGLDAFDVNRSRLDVFFACGCQAGKAVHACGASRIATDVSLPVLAPRRFASARSLLPLRSFSGTRRLRSYDAPVGRRRFDASIVTRELLARVLSPLAECLEAPSIA